jgi:hypothetical protein
MMKKRNVFDSQEYSLTCFVCPSTLALLVLHLPAKMAEQRTSSSSIETESLSPPPQTSSNNNNLAPFNPSSETAQRQSIALMNLQANDILFDLGCGDGRLLIRAVSEQPGLRCVGVEIDPVFVERARKAIHQQLPSAVQDRVQIRCQDVTQVLQSPVPASTTNMSTSNTPLDEISIHHATVIYLYLLPRGLQHIRTMLDRLVQQRIQTGQSLRVVAYTFSVKGWEPTRIDTSTKSGIPIYLYEFSL